MNIVQTKPISDYVWMDRTESKLMSMRDLYIPGSSEYNAANDKYKKRMMNNRGITLREQKLLFNEDKFAKYFFHHRIHALMIFGLIHLLNIREGKYEPVDNRFVLKCMKSVLEEFPRKLWSIGRQNTYFESFKLCLEQIDVLEPDANSILMKNGVLHIDKYCMGIRKTDPFNPNEIHLSQVPHEYDPKANCELFKQTLNDLFNNDTDMIMSFQEMLGSLLYYGSQCKIQKIFVFYGRGANGKTLISNIIHKMLGENNCSSTYLENIQEKFGYQDMYGKMVNISPEAEKNKILCTAALKSLTGGDAITYEFKYRAAFTARSYTKLIICTNHELSVDDDSNGFTRRIHVFPFLNSYHQIQEGETIKPNQKVADPNLEEKLMNEIPGIINFSLEGLRRLIENNWVFTKCDKVNAYNKQYKNKANEIESFVDQCLLFIEDSRIRTSDVYSLYNSWCGKVLNKGATYGKTEFRKRLSSYLDNEGVVWTIKEIKGIEHYKGLAPVI